MWRIPSFTRNTRLLPTVKKRDFLRKVRRVHVLRHGWRDCMGIRGIWVMNRKIASFFLFLVIFFSFYIFFQKLLVPRWNYPYFHDFLTKSLDDFRKLEPFSVDAIFLGSSHAGEEISPMQIYKETGIPTYNLGTSCQPTDASLFLLYETFKTQSPKYVFLDVSSLFLSPESGNEGRTYILDSSSFSKEKIRLATSCGDGKGLKANIFAKSEELISVLFPLYKYHANWSKLTKNNFNFGISKKNNYSTFGFDMFSDYAGEPLLWADLNEIEAQMLGTMDSPFFVGKINEADVHKLQDSDAIYNNHVTSESMIYLKRIKETCDKNGAVLILAKNPVIMFPNLYRSSWTRSKSAEIKKIASELQIEFLDLQYDFDLGIDYKKDFKDFGMHLNYYGDKKVSSFFASYLKARYRPNLNQFYEKNIEKYDRQVSVALLQLEMDFCKYINLLNNFPDELCVLMAINDCGLESLSEDEKNALKTLGIESQYFANWPNSFVGIIDNRIVQCDIHSNNKIEFSYNINDKNAILLSKGFLQSGGFCSIEIEDTEYSVCRRGLNIVIYDKKSKTVIDSVCFDFFGANRNAQRKEHWIYKRLRDYMNYLISENTET